MVISELLLPMGLAFIMFAMGLGLKLGDFTRLARRPRAVALGLFVQMLLLPLLAFALLALFPMRPAYAVGMMILAACPGGVTSNMITHIARGDAALSITLTAISSLAGMVSTPLIVGFALYWFMGQTATVPAPKMAIGVFLVSTLPVITGMAAHHLAPGGAAALERWIRPLALMVFGLIVIAAFASQWRPMLKHIGEIGPLVAMLNVLIMAAGLRLAAWAGLSRPQQVAVAIEGGLQNGALGIFVATTLLASPAMMTPSITYALVMNLSAAAFIAWRLFRPRSVWPAPRR